MTDFNNWSTESLLMFSAAFVFFLAIMGLIESRRSRSIKIRNNRRLAINKVKKEYIMLHGGFSTDAEKLVIMEQQIKVLKRKHPGRTYQWYAEKVLYDLKRDMRL